MTARIDPVQQRTVAHFVDADTYGGCEEMISTLMGAHDKSCWQPVLLHYDLPGMGRLAADARRRGIACHAVPRPGWRSLTGAMWSFWRSLRAVNPAVFHAHLNWPLGCRREILAARIAGVPKIVATTHLYTTIDDVRWSRLKQGLQDKAIDRYIAVSGEVKERLCVELGVPGSKIRVVRNGIRFDAFTRAADPALRARLAAGSEAPLVLTPARLHHQKGHRFLLEAAAQIPDALFLFAGDGPERPRLEKQARELGIARRVRFLGQQADIAALLANCDLCVLPSLYEGLPLAVLEAMASGTPVIATAIGGTSEAVENGVSGLLVPPEDPDRLAEAIDQVLSDRHFAGRLAQAGKARVRGLFSSEAMARGTEAVYEEILSPSRQNQRILQEH